MSKNKTTTVTNNRNAVNGRFVTENYAKKHPNTTVKETNKVPTKKSK